MHTKSSICLLSALLLAAVDLAPAQAQSDSLLRGRISTGPQFEVFTSSISFDPFSSTDLSETFTEGTSGLRGSFHVTDRFVLEGTLNRFHEIDFYFADLSAKYYLRNHGRAAVYMLAGPGIVFGSDLVETEATLHAALGLEVPVSEHIYLRPELRGRWALEDLDGGGIADASLAVGWRF